MHIDMTMRRLEGVSPTAGDPVAMMLAIAATSPRQDVERAIDAMIAALDTADGDPDTEDNGDAETLTAFNGFHRRGMNLALTDDHEDGDEDCCPAGDDNPCRSDSGPIGDDDREQGTWEHHERQPSTISVDCEDSELDGSTIRHAHRDRLRATRCRAYGWGGQTFFTLDRHPLPAGMRLL